MTLISDHIEPDTRERILVVAERLFREIGYQKTTVADIAKVLRMSPANVYRFFDSKKAIHQGVARTLMGGVEDAAHAIAARNQDAGFPRHLERRRRDLHGVSVSRHIRERVVPFFVGLDRGEPVPVHLADEAHIRSRNDSSR